MDPATATLITGGMQFGSSMYTNQMMDASSAKSRRWSKYMSDTAHEREVRDLRNAGLNPILSATGGQGASTPASTPAEVDNPGAAVTSALEARRLAADLKNVESQTKLNQDMAKREQATAKNLKDQNAGIKAESQTKDVLLQKVIEGMGFINKAPKDLKETGRHLRDNWNDLKILPKGYDLKLKGNP